MNIILFPGQGSQYPGMGKYLFENFQEAKDVFSAFDTVLKRPFSDELLQATTEVLKETSFQQLAILAVSLAAWEVFKKTGIDCAYFTGLSLGEYSCLYPAGVLSLEEVILLVKERAEAMSQASEDNPSCMFGVLGMTETLLRQYQEAGFYVANINSEQQITISLSSSHKERVQKLLQEKGAKVIELEVSGGFHSPFMKTAQQRLERVIARLPFKDAQIPIVSNYTAKIHSSSQEIKRNLLCQLTAPVLWKQSIELLRNQGASMFFEVGPSKILKGILRKIERGLCVYPFETREDIEKVFSREAVVPDNERSR